MQIILTRIVPVGKTGVGFRCFCDILNDKSNLYKQDIEIEPLIPVNVQIHYTDFDINNNDDYRR